MIHVAVIGLGQIGGSIVMSLRKRNSPYHITGIDMSRKRLKLLKPLLDQASIDVRNSRSSDLVVLCMHFEDIRRFLMRSAGNQLLLDVCSGKEKLLQIADRRNLRFVGGHPLAGNEFQGEKGWRDDLFVNAPFFLCPAKNVSPKDVRLARKFVRDLGSKPVPVDPALHDRYLAVTSHLPALLSGLLVEMARDVPHSFRGPGFRSMTRLASTSPELLETFRASNDKNIRQAAAHLRKLLGHQTVTSQIIVKKTKTF